MELQNLVGVVLGMGGFGALVSALVNALKKTGLVKDGQAQTWVTGLNLAGVLALYGLGVSGVPFDMQQADATLKLVAEILVTAGQLVVALGGSTVFYGAVRGAPVIGKSHSV